MTIALLFGVHAHQPVGNFDEVIAEAHVRCYGKFLQVMQHYPDFRFTVHFSGWLLAELQRRYPADMELLARMTARGQVEWFGSGDTEPVLAMIPERDRLTQLNGLSDRIERMTGQRPKGAWLTERVWESNVVGSLAKSGIRFVAVDDYHFLCAGTDPAQLDSFHSTEDNGHTVDLFPISEQLRYRLPFSPASEAVRYIEELDGRGQSAAIYFDDIEKFGIWPETYDWVYERGWLTQFVEGVLASPRIRTMSFTEYHAAHPTRGLTYLPTTSYIEMNEWSLPARAARDYAALVQSQKDAGLFERNKAYLRGGIWRNFISRYPESNWMHKRMLGLSARFTALSDGQRSSALLELLHRAQANDAYWHGLFGGLYLPHLRRAIWNNIIALEAGFNRLAAPLPVETVDLDLDGRAEHFLRNPLAAAVVREDGDACVVEFSSYPLKHNFGDTLRRHEESYHAKLGQAASTHAAEGGIASPHERVSFKQPITLADAAPDTRPRGIGVDAWVDAGGTTHALDAYTLEEANAGGARFTAAAGEGKVHKHVSLAGAALKLAYRTGNLEGTLQVCLNLAMPSCDGPAGRYVEANGNVPGGFGAPLALENFSGVTLEDAVLGGRLKLSADPPAQLRAQMHQTVSQSEAGFEKIMQAVEITLAWPASPAGEFKISLEAASLTPSPNTHQ
ncbi:MAG TPA: alpha-amylase/4-alpha-glucanotransferase domain-containing protein [Burkholderiales bacterium]